MSNFKTELMGKMDAYVSEKLADSYHTYGQIATQCEDLYGYGSDGEQYLRNYIGEMLYCMFTPTGWDNCFNNGKIDIPFLDWSRTLSHPTDGMAYELIVPAEVMTNESYDPIDALEEEYRILLKVASYGEEGIKNFNSNNETIILACNDGTNKMVNAFTGLLQIGEKDRDEVIEALATDNAAYEDLENDDIIRMYTEEPDSLLRYHQERAKKAEKQKTNKYPNKTSD